jgi:hypothetical protein
MLSSSSSTTTTSLAMQYYEQVHAEHDSETEFCFGLHIYSARIKVQHDCTCRTGYLRKDSQLLEFYQRFLYLLLVQQWSKIIPKLFLVFRRVRNIAKSDSLPSSRLSVHPSVRMELGSHWADFHNILNMFRKSVDKIQVSLKSKIFQTNWRENQKTHFTFSNGFSISRTPYEIIWRHNMARQAGHGWQCGTIRHDRLGTDDNVAQYGTADWARMTIWHGRLGPDENVIRRMRFALWTTKATETLSEYVIDIALPRQQ